MTGWIDTEKYRYMYTRHDGAKVYRYIWPQKRSLAWRARKFWLKGMGLTR